MRLDGSNGHDASPFRIVSIDVTQPASRPPRGDGARRAPARRTDRGSACRNASRAFVGDGAVGVDQVRLELQYRLRRPQAERPARRGSARRCCCASAVPIAPGDVPVTAATLPVQEFWPQGRAPQSMAFLSTAGIERLCSGVTNSTASAAAISRLEADDARRQVGFVVLVVERQIVDLHEAGSRSSVAPELDQRLRQLAVDGFAAVAADDDGDLEFGHGDALPFVLGYGLIPRLDR